MKNINSVILLGLFPTSINAARIFHKRRVPVIGYDYDETRLGFHSRMIQTTICPPPFSQSEELVHFLRDEISHLKVKPMLIPASDEFACFLNNNREQFEDIAYFLLPSKVNLEFLLDKKLQFEAAEKAGLNVPKYFSPASLEELEAMAGHIVYPVFIKARKSFQWKKYYIDKGFTAGHPNELKEIAERLFNQQIDFLVQEIIQGNIKNNIEINILRLNPDTIYSHTIRKIRQYPIDFGTATSVHTDTMPELEDAAVHFINQTDLTGFSNTEFKFDKKTQKCFFIETNSRIWLQVDLCEYLDDNLLVIAYNRITESTLEAKSRRRKKVYWIDFPDDLFSLIKQSDARFSNYLKWLKNIIQAKSHGTFYWRDPFPFFMYVLSVLKRKMSIPRGEKAI